MIMIYQGLSEVAEDDATMWTERILSQVKILVFPKTDSEICPFIFLYQCVACQSILSTKYPSHGFEHA